MSWTGWKGKARWCTLRYKWSLGRTERHGNWYGIWTWEVSLLDSMLSLILPYGHSLTLTTMFAQAVLLVNNYSEPFHLFEDVIIYTVFDNVAGITMPWMVLTRIWRSWPSVWMVLTNVAVICLGNRGVYHETDTNFYYTFFNWRSFQCSRILLSNIIMYNPLVKYLSLKYI